MTAETNLPRPLDRGEVFFWFLDRVSPNNFVVIAEGEGKLPQASLQAALDRAQQEHPLLRACITASEGRLWFVPGPQSRIPLIIEKAEEDWREQLARHMVQPFALDSAPLLRACRIDLPQSRWVFALIFDHCIADGRSGCKLLFEILEQVGGIERPPQIRRNFPAMHEIFPTHLQGQTGEDHAIELKQVKRLEFKEQGKPDEFPAFTRNFGVTDPGLVSFRISAEPLARIAERAREEQSSVNGAVGAAQLLALQAAFGDGAPRLLSQVHATDLRDTLVYPVDHSTPGAYVSMITSTQRVAGPESFWSVARGLTQDVRRQLLRGDGHQFFRLLPPMESFSPDEEGMAAFREMIRAWPLSNMLSNVGRLPALDKAANIQLRHVSFALCPNPSVVVFCTATTYQGSMTININYEKNRLAEPVLRQIATVYEQQLLACAA